MFAVNRGNIENRIDPHFYFPSFRKVVDNIKAKSYERLENLVSFSNETTDFSEFENGEFDYLEIAGVALTENNYTTTKTAVVNAPSRAKMKTKIGDICISTTRPNRGAIVEIKENGIIASTGFSIIREVKRCISKKWLLYTLLSSPILTQMLQRSSGGNYPAIIQDELKKLYIPVCAKEKQEKMIALLDNALQEKANRLKQATEEYQQAIERFERETALFDFSSFDNKLFFSVHLKDIKGKRFDVKNVYYCQSIATKEIINSTLGNLTVDEPCYGTSATAIEKTSEEQPKYIRITDFDDFGIEENHEYMTAETYAEKHLLRKNDILFARTGGTVGKTYFYDGSIGNAVFAGYCIRFRFDESKVIPKYVYWCTKTSSYQNWVKGIQRPSGQPNINKEEYKSFEIALPCLEEQRKLVEFMDKAFLSCRQTIKQAESEWQSAKEQFEKELLK